MGKIDMGLSCQGKEEANARERESERKEKEDVVDTEDDNIRRIRSKM